MPADRILVIIPTYNEKENVLALISDILKSLPHVQILVVDDNSPDRTHASIADLAQVDPRVHLLWREKKEGLGRAYVAGFEWALNRGFQIIAEMDADHSHRVVDLARLLSTFTSDVQFVIGSRWVPGGAVRNWEWYRYLLSRFGNIYVNCVLSGGYSDWTGGFNIWRDQVLRKIQLKELESQGYSFQIELKYRAFRLNFKGIEVPIVFEERRLGRSKMSLKIIFEALIRVWGLRSKV